MARHNQPAADVAGSAALSRADVYRELRNDFRGADIPTADLDARILLCAALNISHENFVLYPDQPVDKKAQIGVSKYRERRLKGEPVARLLGNQEFWSMSFVVNDATLVPRPDTEILVEVAVDLLRASKSDAPQIVDLGTGTGCILISILQEIPDATGHGVDISERAIAAATENARRNGVAARTRFSCGSWLEPIDRPVDLVVSNPPYIPSSEIEHLAKEVSIYDPRLALNGGDDGLDAYRQIGLQASHKMKSGGKLLLEIGSDQAGSVDAIMKSYGLTRLQGHRPYTDLSGIERVLVFGKL